MKHDNPFWYDSVAQFLAENAPAVTADEIVAQIQAGTLRWSSLLSDGRELWLLRLTNPAVERDEVFLGNVLFNDWLNKSVKPAVENVDLGLVHTVTNNLDCAYFLMVTSASFDQIKQAYRHYLIDSLPKLFFGDNDPEKGIHGDFKNMFTFLKSDFEPFPVFPVPMFLARPLEQHVRSVLNTLIERPYLDRETRKPTSNFRTLQATMAFFYGRTSGSEGDCQSHPTFMARMVAEYGLITATDLRRVFRLNEETCPGGANQRLYKEAVQKAINDGAFDEEQARALFRRIRKLFADSIEQEAPDTPFDQSWLLPYLRHKGKLPDISPDDFLDTLLHRVMLGEQTLGLTAMSGERCRVCGDQLALVEEKNILLGISVGKFYNQLVNQQRKHIQRLCIRCAFYAYLTVKQLRSTTSRKFPIPQQGNLIFHYGPHSDREVEVVGRRMDALLTAIHKTSQIRAEHLERMKSTAKEDRKAWTPIDEQQALIAALAAQAETGDVSEEDLQRLQELIIAKELPSAVQQTLGNVKSAHVLNIGLGEWRLIAFAIDHLQDESELAQRRFVRGRLVVFTLMSFLQQVCGCHGPYYFQSPPRLAADQTDAKPDTFYVRDRAIDAVAQRRRYRTASEFAFRVIGGYGRASLRDRLKLSDELEQMPLETFSDVLRDSPFHISSDIRDAKYQPLRPADSDRLEADLAGVRGGWEYMRVYKTLHEMAQTPANGED